MRRTAESLHGWELTSRAAFLRALPMTRNTHKHTHKTTCTAMFAHQEFPSAGHCAAAAGAGGRGQQRQQRPAAQPADVAGARVLPVVPGQVPSTGLSRRTCPPAPAGHPRPAAHEPRGPQPCGLVPWRRPAPLAPPCPHGPTGGPMVDVDPKHLPFPQPLSAPLPPSPHRNWSGSCRPSRRHG